MLYATTPPWQRTNPHGAAVAMTLANPPPPGLNLRTYNISDGLGFDLPQPIQETQLRNYDVMLLIETKIPDDIYCTKRIGYDVV